MATKRYSSVDLQKWLIEKASGASPALARKYISSNDQRGRDSTIIGKLYFFRYDPKTKDKLWKYDKFPMVFPIEKYSDGFLGLNLHYVDYSTRQALISKLLEYRNNDYMDKRTKLKLSYELIVSISKLEKLAKPCVKRYLFSHCKSRFIEIYPEEYDKAIQLPVEEWVYKR